MRHSAIIAAIVLTVVGSDVGKTETPVANEVPLGISERGSVHSRPDRITINVPVMASAETAAAARAANQAIVDKLIRDLLAQGLDRDAVQLAPTGGAAFGFVGNEAYDPDNPVAPNLPGASTKRRTATSLLQIKLHDQAGIETVRRVLDLDDQAMAGPPQLALADDGDARRQAATVAIAKARADADAYAASVGMRVSRMTRVSNYGPAGSGDNYTTVADNIMAMAQGQTTSDVTTSATVWIDFMMVPR